MRVYQQLLPTEIQIKVNFFQNPERKYIQNWPPLMVIVACSYIHYIEIGYEMLRIVCSRLAETRPDSALVCAACVFVKREMCTYGRLYGSERIARFDACRIESHFFPVSFYFDSVLGFGTARSSGSFTQRAIHAITFALMRIDQNVFRGRIYWLIWHDAVMPNLLVMWCIGRASGKRWRWAWAW